MNVEQIEKQWQQRANSMSLAEVEDMLVRLPTQPKIGTEVIARAVCMARRIELVNAARPDPNAPPADPGGMCEVNVPPGGAGCIMSRTLRNKYYYAVEMPDGRQVICMPWPEFCAIAFATTGNGAGPNGAAWLDCNPHLVDRFPKNPPPPPPAPLQE